jgi:HD-GYP domain-containing protein (c-di-GMP phosphodiesterase class II)/putative methionine-R-sulfoxide reductase with GAF domain
MVGHLKLLQAIGSKLNRLQDVEAIGRTVLAELKALIDYHNCRIYLLDPDDVWLRPVAFEGDLTEYEGETEDALLTKVGEGITGRVAEVGEPIYAPDAEQCEFAVHIDGTPTIDESILAVPLKFDDRVIGVVVLSKLGLNQFDVDDLRLLESLASHAAVGFENARLFEEQRQAAETANELLGVSQALTQTRDPHRVMQRVVSSMSGLLGCSLVSAWIRGEDGSFTCEAQVGYRPQEETRVLAMQVPTVVASKLMVSTDAPFVLSAEVVADMPPEFVVRPSNRPVLVAPVKWEPDGLGALAAFPDSPSRTFTERDYRLARGVADLASLAMGNATRFADLERAYLQTIEVLANALEAKDEYTSGHAREVAEFSITVGREMGLGQDELRVLELAGIFHDIGKIGVASNIINKPGALEPDEMAEMQKHPEIGAQILAPVEFLQPVRPIVRAGHERWDGNGYPDGLQGEDIPLGARIIFVCDAYHAMTSDRAYRKALPEGEALRRLREASGTQFDPAVIAAFLRAHGRGQIRHPHGAHS